MRRSVMFGRLMLPAIVVLAVSGALVAVAVSAQPDSAEAAAVSRLQAESGQKCLDRHSLMVSFDAAAAKEAPDGWIADDHAAFKGDPASLAKAVGGEYLGRDGRQAWILLAGDERSVAQGWANIDGEVWVYTESLRSLDDAECDKLDQMVTS